MITHEIRDNPEKIWLEPGCSPERCWCENVLDDCEEPGCGAKAVGYVREDIVDHATREAARIADENARLRAGLVDPAVVHINMLAGVIAKPSLAQIIHIYGEDALRAALEGK